MTVAELIRRSMKDLGVLAAEETPSAAEQSDALETLNDMLDSWAGERLVLFATLRSTHALTPSLNPHTIGDGGTFDTTRPVRIDRASITPAGASGAERDLDILSDAEWQATQGKDSVGTPTALWVESAHPLMKLWLNPIPSVADTLVLYTWQQLGRFASVNDDVDFPPGYARAFRANLAVELAPTFGVAVSGELGTIAADSKTMLKRLNHKPNYASCDLAVLGTGRGNIITG